MKTKLKMLQENIYFMWLCESTIIYLMIVILLPYLIKGLAVLFCTGVVIMSLNNK